ncbi:MAG TPA: DUF3822 family protein [Hanamia sp.]|nr:DUF3822 family protein [Hanamia sp.]
MRTAFEIIPSSLDSENCTLICELSTEGFSYVIKDEEKNSVEGLAVHHYDKSTPPVGFPIALQILFHKQRTLSQRFKKTIINYSLPESVLMPFPLYNSARNGDVINLVHGDLHGDGIILADKIEEQKTYNVFRLRTDMHEVIQSQFPNAEHSHQYSVLLKRPVIKHDSLFVIFYARKIVVSLLKNGTPQLINTFRFQTAEDVSYTLLNICKQFDVPNIALTISGLLERKSELYKEIYKYFETIDMAPLPDCQKYHEEILVYPSHYFSHIFAIDPCE